MDAASYLKGLRDAAEAAKTAETGYRREAARRIAAPQEKQPLGAAAPAGTGDVEDGPTGERATTPTGQPAGSRMTTRGSQRTRRPIAVAPPAADRFAGPSGVEASRTVRAA